MIFNINSTRGHTGSLLVNTIGFVSVYTMQSLWSFGGKLCNRSLGVHETKWASNVKRESDIAQSYTSFVIIVTTGRVGVHFPEQELRNTWKLPHKGMITHRFCS